MMEALRRLLDEPRPGGEPPVRRWEVVLVGLAIVLGIFEAAFEPEVTWRPAAAALVVVLVPTLFPRRSRPLVPVLVIFGLQSAVDGLVWITSEGTTLVGVTFVSSVIAAYAVARWGSGREIALGAPAVVLLRLVTDPSDELPVVAALVSSTAGSWSSRLASSCGREPPADGTVSKPRG